jgi:hypothetical protein
LCSERNAIGTALTANPSLNRKNVLLVAVLALEKLTNGSTHSSPNKRLRSDSEVGGGQWMERLNPCGPCVACQECLKKISEVNPDFKVMTFTDMTCQFVYLKEVY